MLNSLNPSKYLNHLRSVCISSMDFTENTPAQLTVLFFGALGGYRGSDGVPPGGPTIDYELSKVLPQNLLPHLCIGMDSIENMVTKPTVANLSASRAGFSASCLSLSDGTQ